jgi:6-pyruvoyltetrahydropterin/6-carboxytetrahydropterin synthase
MDSYISIDGWRSNIRFSSAHIIPEYEKCGRLHGHTYAVHVKIFGEPDAKGIIMDFSLVKEVLKQVVADLDHKILIPEESKNAKIQKENDSVKVSSMSKNYVFPYKDCVFLPINSTSAENLSKYILNRLTDEVNFPKNIKIVEIGVDEGYGQGARVSKKL